MNQPKRLIVMAGGTGGHVFPGLTVAHYLMEKGWQVYWLGTADRIEAYLVPRYGIKIDFIRISGLRNRGIRALVLAPVRILNAWRQARIIMKRIKPNVALGMGGYVSGPGGLAAWSLKIPIVLHEQNGTAGLTNKWLAKIASKVLQAFPGTLPNAEVVGNPIRTDVLALLRPEIRLQGRVGPIRVLVIGGSQGAMILNQIMSKVAAKLGDMVIIWHQSGKGLKKIVEQEYSDNGQSQHKVTEFIDDMAEAYDWADVVVCRSGALTVSEIAAVGLPAIFVPFQHKDRHQYWNALPLEKAGAAKIFEQQKLTADKIAATLAGWDRETLLEMARKARTVAMVDAAERIAQRVHQQLRINLNTHAGVNIINL